MARRTRVNTGLIAFYMHDLSGGGVERMRLTLIAELRARGLDVCLIVGERSGALSGCLPLDLHVVELQRRGMLPSARPLARVLRHLRPSFLVASLDHNNVTALLAGLVARSGTRVIVCQHNALSAELRLGWRYRAIPWFYWLLQRAAAGFVAVSQGVADDLCRTAGIRAERVTTIYNPVIDCTFVQRAAAARPAGWPVGADVPAIVFAGRLTAQKDPDLLLQAFSRVACTCAAELVVLGEGPLRESLQHRARALGLERRVHFVGYQPDPLPWIAHAACLVLASRYEGLGNVLIEALACGTPVVSTDCPFGPAEILGAGRYGTLVPVGDAEAMAAALLCLLQSDIDRAALQARAAVFTDAACADGHLALFARLQSSRPATHGFGLLLCALPAEQIVSCILQPPPERGANLIVTPNIDHIRLLRRPAFARAYASARMICPDGWPVLAYARLRGLPLRSRVTGCDIFRGLAEHRDFARRDVCIVVESEATRAAVQAWAERGGYRHLRVLRAPDALSSQPPAAALLAAEICAFSPDILVLTLGAPTSEEFLLSMQASLPTCWALCVGQAVRVHLDLVRRAPAAWQRLGLEWAWRVAQEPNRLARRYMRGLAWYPVAVFLDIAGLRRGA